MEKTRISCYYFSVQMWNNRCTPLRIGMWNGRRWSWQLEFIVFSEKSAQIPCYTAINSCDHIVTCKMCKYNYMLFITWVWPYQSQYHALSIHISPKRPGSCWYGYECMIQWMTWPNTCDDTSIFPVVGKIVTDTWLSHLLNMW